MRTLGCDQRSVLQPSELTITLVPPPSAAFRAAAAERLAALATPPGALGQLGDLGVWASAVQGAVPPRDFANVRLVIFAGDHGVAEHGVSAFPPEITGAMVRTFLAGRAGVNALAQSHRVSVRVLDLGCREDFNDLPVSVREPLAAHKVRRSSRPLHLTDALTPDESEDAFAAGQTVAREEIAAGADLLISGDMGIGNTTAAAALVAHLLGLPAAEVVGRGTGVDEDGLARKTAAVDAATARVRSCDLAGIPAMGALSSADLVATTGYLVAAARAGVPVLLDGLMSVACALWADALAPGASAWFAAGHRSTEPAQSLALDKLALTPLLDLGMRLGEGSGAVAAVPVLRSAVALLRDVALLTELG